MTRIEHSYGRVSQLILAAILIVLNCYTIKATGTVCASRTDLETSYQQSSDVFIGEVVESNLFSPSYVLKVTKVFKGHSGRRVRVLSGYSDEYLLQPGRRYLVYGNRIKDSAPLRVFACGRTRLLSQAQSDILYLKGQDMKENRK